MVEHKMSSAEVALMMERRRIREKTRQLLSKMVGSETVKELGVEKALDKALESWEDVSS